MNDFKQFGDTRNITDDFYQFAKTRYLTAGAAA
jgi:hypothetical protein